MTKRRWGILGILLVLVAVGSMVRYKRHYDATYTFKGLGEIYRDRSGETGEKRMFFKNEPPPPMEETASLPTFEMPYVTTLADRGSLRFLITFRTRTERDVKRLRDREERLRHAMDIIFSRYVTRELVGEVGRKRAEQVVDRVFSKYGHARIRHAYVTRMRARGGRQEGFEIPASAGTSTRSRQKGLDENPL